MLEAESVHCVVTSPPYFGLRDYGVAGQIGLEATPDDYVGALVGVFREVWRVLRHDGTVWLNIGDSYNNFRVSKGPGQALHGRDKLHGKPAPESGRRGWTGLKEKDLMMIPARVALALQADGWWIRSEIVWAKPNPMPESVTDRPSTAHEKIFLLTKSARYFYDAHAVRQPAADASIQRWAQDIGSQDGSQRADGGGKMNGNMKAVGGPKKDKQRGHGRRHDGFNDRWDAMSKTEQQAHGANLKNVWNIATKPFSEAHFATFPPELAERCIKAGCPEDGTVLDPFGGAGTTGLVADRMGRDAILIELNPEYCEMARARIEGDGGLFAEVTQTAEAPKAMQGEFP